MAVYCGTDIVSVERIKNSIEELGDTFVKRIYTDEEIEYCESKRMCKYQSYAARFAAKEAAYKAFSPETMDEITWHDAEIIKKPNGKPVMKLNGKLAILAKERGFVTENIDVSLSHDAVYATATVVINN